MIEVLSMTFAAGEVKTFQMPGEYFELLDTMYPVDVMLMQRDGTQLSRLMSAEASYFTRPGRFETYTIYSANAQTVRWFIGSGDAGTRRTSGVVQVVDGGKAVTLAGKAFIATAYATAAVGKVMAVALWNLSADKNLRVKQLRYDVSGAGFSLIHRRVMVALGVKDSNPVSKLLNGTFSANAETRQLTDGAALPASDSAMGVDVTLSRQVLQFIEPIVLPPGTGYMIAGNGAATGAASLSAVWEYVEEAF